MPVPKPHKGEKQDDYMKRCMHEVSKNKDRSNDQNVAICLSTWRKGPDKDKSELTETEMVMSELPFKNLASAREEYLKLSEQLAIATEKLEGLEALETENSDLKTQLETAKKLVAEELASITARDEALVLRDELVSAKDAEIKQLKADVDILNVKCADLAKNQKSVKAQARELVAASAGAPAPVDNAEMEMTEKDLAQAMAATRDPKEMNALYRQLKALRQTQK